eukprot:jgi/Botrbrau1/20981/Bobra.0789s0003.1
MYNPVTPMLTSYCTSPYRLVDFLRRSVCPRETPLGLFMLQGDVGVAQDADKYPCSSRELVALETVNCSGDCSQRLFDDSRSASVQIVLLKLMCQPQPLLVR